MPVSANTLRKLTLAGIVGDALIDLVASIDADMASQIVTSYAPIERPVTPSALRMRRKREKDRASQVTVTVASQVTTPSPRPSPSPDKEIPPTPPKENNLFPDPTPQPRLVGARGAFEKFWSMFPNKVGKAAASKAFEKSISKVDLETMLAALDRYVHKTDDRPWCNPATWLNQERWADQPAQVARGSPSKPLTGLAAVEEKLRREILDEGFNGAQSSDRQDDAGFPFLRLEHQR